MVELFESARERYVNEDVPFTEVLGELIEATNNMRVEQIEYDADFDPMRAAIEQDLQDRNKRDEQQLEDLMS